jgi:hypothetical protein
MQRKNFVDMPDIAWWEFTVIENKTGKVVCKDSTSEDCTIEEATQCAARYLKNHI